MGNPIKGEVDFKVGDIVYQLRLSIEEIIKVEDLLNVGIKQIADSLNDPQTMKAGTVRALLWASLQEKHPGIDLLSAGQIMVIAGIAPTVVHLGKVMQAAFPQGEKDTENPPPKRGRDGTGKASSSRSSRKASRRKSSGD